MTTTKSSAPRPDVPRSKVTIERTYPATLEDIWELWTTKDGLESWWGPEGFRIEVRQLDVRPGGLWEYAMIASAPEQVAFMKRAGMPLTTEQRVTYTEVVARQRLAYESVVDFVPGVASYTASVLIEFQQGPQGVRLKVQMDAMHDAHWTEMARMGWEGQLGKLTKAAASRGTPPGVNEDSP